MRGPRAHGSTYRVIRTARIYILQHVPESVLYCRSSVKQRIVRPFVVIRQSRTDAATFAQVPHVAADCNLLLCLVVLVRRSCVVGLRVVGWRSAKQADLSWSELRSRPYCTAF